MTRLNLTSCCKHVMVWCTAALSLFAFTTAALAAGGGGDGGSGGVGSGSGSGISITYDVVDSNRSFTISDYTTSLGFPTGIFSTTDGRMSAYNGQNAMYSPTRGGWVVSEPTFDNGGTNTWGSTQGSFPPPSGSSEYIVSQACVSSSQVDVTFRAPTCWTLSWASNSCYYPNPGLYDDPWTYRTSFRNGETKTIRMTAGSSYPNALWSASFWTGDYQISDTKPFPYTVRNDCTLPPPPTAALYVRNTTIDSSWTGENIAIDPDDQIALYWTSTNASYCTGTNFGTSNLTSSVTTSVTEPGAGGDTTYRVYCYGPNGGQAYDMLTVNTLPYVLPTASLQVRNMTTGGSWASGVTIDPGDEIELQWSSENTDSCTAVDFFSTGGATSDTESSVDEPDPGTDRNYVVTCEGAGGVTGDSVLVTVNPYPVATVTLEVENTTDGTAWTESNIVVDPGDEIALRWSSTNAVSCSANTDPAGGNFATGGSISDTDTDVLEPDTASGRTYRVACENEGGVTAYDQILVTLSDQVSLTADPRYVRRYEDIVLTWNVGSNDPASCTITGPNYNSGPLAVTSGTDSDVTIPGESTFTLTCGGQTDTATVLILPTVQET